MYHNIHLNYIGRNAKNKNCYLFKGEMLSPLKKKKVLKWKSTCETCEKLAHPKAMCMMYYWSITAIYCYTIFRHLIVQPYACCTTYVLAFWRPVTFYRNALNASSPCICTLILFVTVYVKTGHKMKNFDTFLRNKMAHKKGRKGNTRNWS